MRRRAALLAAALAVTLGLAGCQTLFGVPLAGVWTGVYEPVDGDAKGVLLLDLQTSGSTVTGTWESSLPGSLDRGVLSGVSESLVMLELVSSNIADCRFHVLVQHDKSRLRGGYVADCGDVPSGWVDLTKR